MSQRKPRWRLVVAASVVACAVAIISATAANAADITPTPLPAVRSIFAPTGVPLHDPSVQQSFAYDAVNRVWIFAQSSYPGSPGDLTMTKVSTAGTVLGYMKLKGFGHGLSIGLEPVGATTYVWTESVGVAEPALGGSADAGVYGTKIARFAWRSSATLYSTTAGVALYLGSQPEETPSIDMAHGLIAVHYWSSGAFRYSVYSLAAFKARRYVPLARGVDPPYTATSQGWALNGSTIARLEGNAYESWNPAPGNTVLTMLTTSGVVISRHLVTAMPDLAYREPEGAAVLAGVVCEGFASGVSGARRANVTCGG
jgi:hypothetical protein